MPALWLGDLRVQALADATGAMLFTITGITTKTHPQPDNRWKAALNAFDITFDGRLSAGRK